ncbi:50S ribosomal protein L4 [Reinekea marinisedimentorum]|uniref:Large ribosomal subunit protein uL4 n=1 Tax=Reinekea marinisedimentorum TaxID=230495 RepID=A0A4V2UJ00_9GAMM|nr:50S ribosomal protein L4 [Reinekea marinisedimentorum]TCS38120.1 large subunit ribosomal protein L4 [Reinekea marinisedimentorum]
MDIKVANAESKVELNDATFGNEYNEALVHQVVTAYLAGARQGSVATKNRSDVAGGGAKPWRQKGTGRARAGTIRSPIWVGGGHAFARSPQNWTQKVNKKMYRGAMKSILSELVRQDRLVVVEDLKFDQPKTKAFLAKMKDVNVSNALIVADEVDQNLYLSARNVPHVEVSDVAGVNPLNLVSYEKVVVTVAAIEKLQEVFA